MSKKRITTREKLEMMKQIDERNEQHREEFAEKEAANKERVSKLLDLYINGEISKEELYKRIR